MFEKLGGGDTVFRVQLARMAQFEMDIEIVRHEIYLKRMSLSIDTCSSPSFLYQFFF